MSLRVKPKTVQELRHMYRDDKLDLSPDFQRRPVWNDKKKMLLIDSIARGIPVNALTFYENETEDGIKHEVIDGKQRLSSIFEYFDDKITPISADINEETEEEKNEGQEKSEAIADKKWSKLKKRIQDEFLEYEIPIYFVKGTRQSAVRSFRRMNEAPYALKPQEIRNAVYRSSYFLEIAKKFTAKDEIQKELGLEKDLLVTWGVISDTDFDRMLDIQFYSEIIILKLEGPKNRRDDLDGFYDKYLKAKPKDKKKLDLTYKEIKRALKVIYEVVGDSFRPYFDSENVAYSLIGAFFEKNLYKAPELSKPEIQTQIKDTLDFFGDEMWLCKKNLTNDPEYKSEVDDEFTHIVREFSQTLLAGQKNSKSRREKRISIFHKLLCESVKPPELGKPTETLRKIVWAKSKDKKCGRCNQKVEKYEDYNCGHIEASLYGGKCILSNLRVEHAKCNKSFNQHKLKAEASRTSRNKVS